MHFGDFFLIFYFFANIKYTLQLNETLIFSTRIIPAFIVIHMSFALEMQMRKDDSGQKNRKEKWIKLPFILTLSPHFYYPPKLKLPENFGCLKNIWRRNIRLFVKSIFSCDIPSPLRSSNQFYRFNIHFAQLCNLFYSVILKGFFGSLPHIEWAQIWWHPCSVFWVCRGFKIWQKACHHPLLPYSLPHHAFPLPATILECLPHPDLHFHHPSFTWSSRQHLVLA